MRNLVLIRRNLIANIVVVADGDAEEMAAIYRSQYEYVIDIDDRSVRPDMGWGHRFDAVKSEHVFIEAEPSTAPGPDEIRSELDRTRAAMAELITKPNMTAAARLALLATMQPDIRATWAPRTLSIKGQR